MFQGFSQSASDWFWELIFNNERPWFEAHKEEYIRLLKEPFQALAEDTLAEMQRRFPERDFRLHVARIYRDARRLFGRGPYKDHLWFSIKESSGWGQGRSFWFELGAAEYSYGCGFYSDTAAAMENWRRYVDANEAQMERMAKRLKRHKEFKLGGKEYKRLKADKGELLNPWYNRRWLDISRTHDFGGDLLTPELPGKLCDVYELLMPYYDMFANAFEE